MSRSQNEKKYHKTVNRTFPTYVFETERLTSWLKISFASRPGWFVDGRWFYLESSPVKTHTNGVKMTLVVDATLNPINPTNAIRYIDVMRSWAH